MPDPMRREPPADLFPYFLTLSDLPGPLVWSEFFGNENPVELDVGCGRGLFLVRASLANPHINYLGIELDYKEGRRAARRLMKRNLPNARVLGADVREVFAKFIRPHSVAAVHVYFPDPWWKRKHKKRRLFNDVFVDQLADVLQGGGLVHSWTDVEDYFHVIKALMDHHERFEPLPPPPERQPQDDMDYQTSFERKKRNEGKTIYRGCWRRKPV
ncbi:MAG TPA: tRNA (guanosine(46)-N7)-methyltransferase TrmB [Planctomycetaceae bacterium]|nr:tRNA (guanosine(46)-N7)-methyltransferase TrmB [Planctomycetaceae bacterium]